MANAVEQPSPTLQRAAGRAGTPAEGRVLRARGQQTVRSLLDAGLEVFATRGYHPARVDDIVKVAKTSHGTFYLYFASKEDLFRSLTLDVSEEFASLAASLGPLEPGPTGRAALRRWVADFSDVHGRYGPVIKAWTEAEIEASELGNLGTEMLGGLVSAIAARVAESPATSVDPNAAALAVVSVVERFHYYAMSGQVRADDDAVVDTLTAIVHAALFGPTASQPS